MGAWPQRRWVPPVTAFRRAAFASLAFSFSGDLGEVGQTRKTVEKRVWFCLKCVYSEEMLVPTYFLAGCGRTCR